MGKNEVVKTAKYPPIKFQNSTLSKSSKQLYTARVKAYFDYCRESGQELGIASLTNFLTDLKSASYYNINKIALKQFFLKFYENEPPERKLELVQVFDALPKRRTDKRIKETEYLTIDEVDQLLQAVKRTSIKMALVIEALFWTGCRVSELINIMIEDCSVNKDHVAILIRSAKGGKEHEVYMPKKLYAKIRKEFAHAQVYLFETRNNTQFHPVNVTKYIQHAGKRILNMSISAHSLRHSKAMFLKNEKGLTPDQIAKALGHSSVVTTLEYYFHGTPSAKEQGIG